MAPAMGANGINDSLKNEAPPKDYKIKRDIYERIIAYCEKALPNEACGLLSEVGSVGSSIWPIKNESLNRNRFFMSVDAIKRAFYKMEEKGEHLSAIFHSHPSTPPIPSSYDIKNNPYTSLAYIIVSFYKEKVDMACYKMDGKTIAPMKIIIIDD
jgi:proteasome lid subunit RPN8/RPN11